MTTPLHPVLSIRLFREEKCFGSGVAQLLHHVDEQHSLRAAAQAMDMAYSKAWTMLRRCEEILGFPLLIRTTGGRHGGGASLTPEARAMLETYERYCCRLRQASEELFREEFRDYLTE